MSYKKKKRGGHALFDGRIDEFAEIEEATEAQS
jgi:hypothetical protein